MAIGLPDHFVIARAPHVQVGNPAEITQIGLDAAGVIPAPGDFRASIDSQSKNGKAMLSNLFRERAYLLGERGSLKRRGNRGRIGKLDARLEVGIKLNVRRRCILISVDDLLLETERDLGGAAQCSSFYPEQKHIGRE